MKLNPVKLVLSTCILGASLSLAAPVRAQVSGAQITGIVTDTQGGAVVGAKISARDVATNVTAETTSNTDGAYSLLNLIPADYEVSASATGFRTTVERLTLTVGAKQELNISLTVGQMTQTVEVTGTAPEVELASSTVEGNIEGTEVRELPLNGRDWTTLATLEPGVAQVYAHPQGTQASRGLGLQMTVSGGRPTQNSYRLDGIFVNDYSNAGPGSVLGENLGVDAIQEFSVLTSNYSAEYGMTSGGVINAVTRSGTNSFHGTAFDFVRNDAFDANNYFSDLNHLSKTPLKQNQFGASGGYKVLRDKLFLFGDYEGVRQDRGIPETQFTISNAVRAGNVTDLSTGAVSSVPINSYIAQYLAFFPTPIGPANCTGCNANVGPYDWTAAQRTSENFLTARGDLRISDKDSLFATYVRDPSHYTLPEALDDVFVTYSAYRQAIIIEETHIFSSSFTNTIRAGLDRTDGLTNDYNGFASQAINPAVTNTALNMIPGATTSYGQPVITLQSTGITAPGLLWGGTHQDLYNQILQGYDDAFLMRGKHGLKFGVEYLREHNDTIAVNGINGTGVFTAGLATPQAMADCPKGASIDSSCGALVNFLTDQPRTAATPADLAVANKHYIRDNVFGAYIQDDWRFRQSLTLNLGLRYEMQTNPTEIHGEIGYLSNLYGPSTNLNNFFYTHNPTLKNFEPRLGFAWDPFHNGKTSVRGGFGIFDVLPQAYMNALYNATTAPFLGTYGTVGPPGSATPPAGEWPYGIPALLPVVKPTQVVWAYDDTNIKRDYVYQWNLNVQRQITPTITLTVAYVGSHGVHQPFLTEGANSVQPVDVGNPIPGVGYYWPIPWTNSLPPAQQQAALVNPKVQIIRAVLWQSQSYFNALEVKVDKRVSRGLQVTGAFTWGSSIDTSSGSAAADTFANEWNALPYYDFGLTKGLSAFDIKRNLVINALYTFPNPKFAAPLLGGWQIGGIATVQDGEPIMPSMGMDAPDMLGELITTLNPPNVVAGCNPVDPQNVHHYLNISCFSMVPQTTTNTPYCDTARATAMGTPGFCPNIRGDLGRNSILGPGVIDFNLSVVKNTYIRKISETANLQFRFEAFNATNRPDFSPPTINGNTGGGTMEAIFASGQPNPQFGQLTSTAIPNREIQLALKLIW